MTTYPPEPWTLVGRMDLSTFLVPTEDLPTATWPDGWRPLALGGRTPVGAAWVDYAPGGAMSYRELLVAVAGRVGARVRPHIVAIWVDSPASRDGGRELWGIPKGLARSTGVAEGAPEMTLEGADRPAASAVLRHGPRLPGTPARRVHAGPGPGRATLREPGVQPRGPRAPVRRVDVRPRRRRWPSSPATAPSPRRRCTTSRCCSG